MSSRTKRSSKAAAAAASAAPAVPTPAAAAPAAKSKGRRRKAEETDEATAMDAQSAEAEQSAIAVPSSKRARALSPSSRKQKAARPTNAAPAAAASASSSAAAAAASSSSLATADPLSDQWSSFLRPSSPVPLRLLFDSVLSLLSLKDLVCGLAGASKAGLEELGRFAYHCRAEQERDALLFPIVARKRSKVAAPASVPQPSAVPVAELRTLLCPDQFPRVSPLFSSRLRFLVQSVNVFSVLDTTEVSDLARKLPWILSLTVQIQSSVAKPHFAFPPRLQHLSVVPHRNAPSGKSSDVQWEYVSMVLEAVATLQHLRALTLRTSHLGGFGWGRITDPKWLRPLATMAGPLASLTLNGALAACVPLLSYLPSLTELQSSGDYAYEAALAKWFTEDKPELPLLRELPLDDVVIKNADLACFSSSLTDLRPQAWGTAELGWVASFKALRRIRFAFYTQSIFYSMNEPSGHVNPPIESVVATLVQLPSLTDVCVRYKDLTDAHFELMLSALPLLTALELQSDCITSLAPLSLHTHLQRQLRRLSITLPLVPRDHIDHVMRLTALESLSIAGSFTEPLFARQLAPFLPPYPREPMHWLRSFKPRSDREAVPAPPVDLVARAAAHAAFDARVRAGEVRAAELLNAAQLSGVLTFLDCRDFSHAGQSCRAWRAAACLPSAWSLKANSAATTFSPDDAHSESGQSWLERSRSRISPLLFDGHTRVLGLSAFSPQISTAILPQAPLWKHACALRLYTLQSRQHDFSVPSVPRQTPSDNPLATMSALARLDALDVAWTHWENEAEIEACMKVVGPRLKRAKQVSLPVASLHCLRNVEQLVLSCAPHHENSITRSCPGTEMLKLERLRSLVLSFTRWDADLGSTLRMLTHRHLRDLVVEMSDAQQSRNRFAFMAQHLPLRGVATDAFLPRLIAQLAGVETLEIDQNQGAPAPTPAAAAATSSSAAFVEPLGLDDEAGSSALSSSSPALLESLRIASSCHFSQQLSFAPLLRLTKLRSLDLQFSQCGLTQLSAIDEAAARGEALPPLEFLSLRMCLVGLPLGALARLSTLRELILIPPTVPICLDLSSRCTALWAAGLPLLELLSLSRAQFGVGAWSDLSQLPRLRSLSLASCQLSAPAEIEALANFPALEELTLENVEGLTLQERNWMDGMGKPVEADKTANEDASAAAPSSVRIPFGVFGATAAAAAFAGHAEPAAQFLLLPVVARCRLLRLFRWDPSELELKRSADYTLSRSWIPIKVSKWVVERQQRMLAERRRERQTLRAFLQDHHRRRQAASSSLPPSLRIECNIDHSRPYMPLEIEQSATLADKEQSKAAGQEADGDADDMADEADTQAISSAPAAAASQSSSSSSSSAAAAVSAAASLDILTSPSLTAAQSCACADAKDELTEQREQLKAKIKSDKLASIDPNAPAPKKKTKRRY